MLESIVNVNLGDRSYPIRIGEGNLAATDYTKFESSRAAIIADPNSDVQCYAHALQLSLKLQYIESLIMSFKGGEENKTLKEAEIIMSQLAQHGFGKDSLLIGMGGGVTTDITTAVAANYYGGISHVLVPTTLVAMTDAAIGGKARLNLPEGKNLVGTIYQPKAVIADVTTLKTLSPTQIAYGFAEPIKMTMTMSSLFFEYLEENHARTDAEFYFKVVELSCRLKANVIEKDEKEEEFRKILNYGHTIGHAFEAASHYKIPHPPAISVGINVEGTYAVMTGELPQEALERQNRLLSAFGLPLFHRGGNIEDIILFARRDKKNRQSSTYLVIPNGIGSVKMNGSQVAFPIDEPLIREALSRTSMTNNFASAFSYIQV